MILARTVLATAAVATIATGAAMADTPLSINGTVTDVFGHRYVVDDGSKKYLVHIGPKGSEKVALKSGDKVVVDGDMTDGGELKAKKLAVGGAPAVELRDSDGWWDKLTGNDDDDKPFGPEEAKAIVTKAGYEVVGEPRREKKHFEVLAKKDGKFFEVHAHRNGKVKHERPVDQANSKWGTLVK